MFEEEFSDELTELVDEMRVTSPVGAVTRATTELLLAMVVERFAELGVLSAAATLDMLTTVPVRGAVVVTVPTTVEVEAIVPVRNVCACSEPTTLLVLETVPVSNSGALSEPTTVDVLAIVPVR